MNDLGAADLGKRLRLARERAGVTQAQAADQIEVARTTLVAIESGKAPGAYGGASSASPELRGVR